MFHMHRLLALLISAILVFSAACADEAPPPAKTAPTAAKVADPVELLLATYERDVAAVKKKAEDDVKALTDQCLKQLQTLQDKYTREGKLDEALAVREQIRMFRGGIAALNDPGNLADYSEKVGQSFYFKIMGATNGIVYGSDVYSFDSHLASAAVHAGAINYADVGIVKVTILPGMGTYSGTERNGVTSRNWTAHPFSYKVEAVKPPVEKKK